MSEHYPNTVKAGEWYPVADTHRLPAGFKPSEVRAVATGERRAPRAGEWYLSGAVVEAYRAATDIVTTMHIATLEVCERGVEHWVPLVPRA